MSWYSDGEPFDEYDPPFCENCGREALSAEECRICAAAHYEQDCRDEGQRCETCYFYKWDAVKEIFYCDNCRSEWHGEECYDDNWCKEWCEE